MKGSLLKLIAINTGIFLLLVTFIELSARFFIFLKIGNSTAGLQERTHHLRYQPFVMYGPNWDKVVKEFQANTSQNNCIVALIGGSTAESFPVKELENELTKAAGTSVRIFNGAKGGYNSRQQAIVANLWLPSIKPKLIISLDGANDILHRPRQSRGGTFYLSDTYNEFLSNPLTAPLNSLIINSQALYGLSRLMSRESFRDKPEYSDLVTIYMSAQKSIDATAKGIGSKRLYFLQPFHSFKQRKTGEELAFTHYDYRKKYGQKYFNIISEKLEDLSSQTGTAYIDGRNSYDGTDKHVFTDDVHLTPEGYRIIAKQVGSIAKSNNLLEECAKNSNR